MVVTMGCVSQAELPLLPPPALPLSHSSHLRKIPTLKVVQQVVKLALNSTLKKPKLTQVLKCSVVALKVVLKQVLKCSVVALKVVLKLMDVVLTKTDTVIITFKTVIRVRTPGPSRTVKQPAVQQQLRVPKQEARKEVST